MGRTRQARRVRVLHLRSTKNRIAAPDDQPKYKREPGRNLGRADTSSVSENQKNIDDKPEKDGASENSKSSSIGGTPKSDTRSQGGNDRKTGSIERGETHVGRRIQKDSDKTLAESDKRTEF